MDFILNSKKDNFYDENIVVSKNIIISYTLNNKVSYRELVLENDKYILLVDSNISFINKIKSYNNINLDNLQNNISSLNNGFLICIEKKSGTVYIYTDIFGFTKLYRTANIISSNFDKVLKYSNKETNLLAVYDLLFFNYTLLNRTIVKDVLRISGGQRIKVSSDTIKVNKIFNLTNKVFEKNKIKINHYDLSNLLKESIKVEVDKESENYLTMSGGFDSRALLAAIINLKIPNLNTFTFGQKGNIEFETINKFINNYSDNHIELVLDTDYIKNLKDHFDSFISKNLENPTFHSLIEFEFSNTKISGSNIIAGFMGGELIIGQSVGAEVTFTKLASKLLLSHNIDDFTEELEVEYKKYFNGSMNSTVKDEYLQTLKYYLKRENNENIFDFIINEKFAHFFGNVNNVFRNNNNLITPFINYNILSKLVNSQISFLNKKQFVESPINNAKAKVLYSKTIKHLCPSMSNTKFDTLYKVNDLCEFYNYPKALFYYILNHVGKGNKNKYAKTTLYNFWYTDMYYSMNTEVLEQMKLSIQDSNKTRVELSKKELVMLGLSSAINKINEL